MTKERIPGEAEPTEAQKKAGNYFKGHKYLHGMRVSVENAQGTKRRGTDKAGEPWESEMAHDYGYIRGTTGKDKDHLDVFLGPEVDNPSHKVFIIDQDDDEGNFDEHKIMMGFPSANEAYSAYHANYPEGFAGFNDMVDTDLPTFKRWAFSGKGAKTKRASEMKYFQGGGVETNDFAGVETNDFAKGGTVTGQETVGLGTFGGDAGTTGQAQTLPSGGGAGLGAGSGDSGSDDGLNLPQPLTTGGAGYTPGRGNAPIYSSAGLSQGSSRPYLGTYGVVQPGAMRNDSPANPGEMDPALQMTMQAGGAGWMDRGATAFLGGGFNPWTQEFVGDNGGTGFVAPKHADAQIDQLFELGAALGIDTSKYSRSPGSIDMRGNRASSNDSMALFDAINDATKDYVSVGGLSQGWSGGPGNTVARTIYREQDGRLLPVSRPQFHGNNQDTGFFSDEFKDAVMTTILPAVGGWAGLVGQAGTAAAPYINAAGNVAAGAARGGSQGALGAAFSQLGGAVGGAAAGDVGRTLGSRAASELYSRNRRG